MSGGTNSAFFVGTVVLGCYTTVTCKCAERDLNENKKDARSPRPLQGSVCVECIRQAVVLQLYVLEFDVCSRDDK